MSSFRLLFAEELEYWPDTEIGKRRVEKVSDERNGFLYCGERAPLDLEEAHLRVGAVTVMPDVMTYNPNQASWAVYTLHSCLCTA